MQRRGVVQRLRHGPEDDLGLDRRVVELHRGGQHFQQVLDLLQHRHVGADLAKIYGRQAEGERRGVGRVDERRDQAVDRVGQQVGQREVDIVRRDSAQRNRAVDDDAEQAGLELRVGQVVMAGDDLDDLLDRRGVRRRIAQVDRDLGAGRGVGLQAAADLRIQVQRRHLDMEWQQ